MAFQQTLSSHSVFFIPWDTPANNPSRAQVFHIIKVESTSISYHAFSLSFLQPAPALEYSSSYASASSLTYKGSEDDTSKHGDNILIHPQLGTRRKKARGGHLERLKKETDQHLSLVPARRAEETSREECNLHNHPSGRSLR
ncbi:hypothetical protein ACFX16_046906 [Malus domestica]